MLIVIHYVYHYTVFIMYIINIKIYIYHITLFPVSEQ